MFVKEIRWEQPKKLMEGRQRLSCEALRHFQAENPPKETEGDKDVVTNMRTVFLEGKAGTHAFEMLVS